MIKERTGLPVYLIWLFFTCSLIFNGFITNFFLVTETNFGTIIIDLLIAFLFLIAVTSHIKNPKTYYIFLLLWLLLVFLTCIKLFFDNNPLGERILGVRNNLIYSGIFLCIPLLTRKDWMLKKIYKLIIHAGVILSFFGIIQFLFASYLPLSLLVLKNEDAFTFFGTDIIRATGLTGNTIIFATFTLILYALLLPSILIEFKIYKLISLAIIVLANIFTFSRATFIGLFLILVINVVLYYGRFTFMYFFKLTMLLIVLVGALLIGYITFSNSFFIKRITGQESTTISSTNIHFIQINNSLKYLASYPVSGSGIGSQGPSAQSGEKIITDGFWFQLFLENGIILGSIYVIFYLICFLFAVNVFTKAKNYYTKLLSMAFISTTLFFFIANFINSSFAGRINFIIYWIVFGLLLAHSYNKNYRDEAIHGS